MSAEEELHSPSLGLTSSGEGIPMNVCDLDNSDDLGGKSRAQSCLHVEPSESEIRSFRRQSSFLQTLMDAEAAANSAVVQLLSFQDAAEEELACAKDKQWIARQVQLLLDKLKDFRKVNKSVRQGLKQLQDSEADRSEVDHQMVVLQKKIQQAESENEHLKKDLSETQQRVNQLMDLHKEEQENIKSAVHITKSVEATRAHLQGQLRNKEAQNNRLSIQLRTLERTVVEQKLQIADLRASVASAGEKAAQEKESLKKAARAQKLRAERFEVAVEKCYAQLREKDSQLSKAREDAESSRLQAEREADEKDKLCALADSLNRQIAELTARLQETDRLTGDLHVNNALLKITELEAEVDEWRIKYMDLVSETEKWRERKEAEVDQARRELQGRADELKAQRRSLSDTEQSLSDCWLHLQRLERSSSEKAQSIRQLQAQMKSEAELLSSSEEMKGSIQEANSQLQEHVHSLQKRMDMLQLENLELVRRLAAQDEALGCSSRQLDRRSCECQALNRQLEAALADVRQQVIRVKEQAASREEALQNKILQLEAERSRRLDELRLLRHSKVTAQKQFEARLKQLQLSLDRSESHKQSIQNYLDFLRKSYRTIFSEG
ncbi:outer dense fiber protein 2-like [Salarias fasciatus]|uniref:outer dense fiber protein 2-like n=1 Tax=Salarias fasciatus TaxID=181472 RepID=UPI001176DBE3|nr:outer dense fiber protein 2-like [Salarias fasciatus]